MQIGNISLGIEASIRDVPLIAELKLKTWVLHVTHVTDWLGLTYVAWDRHSNQHTVGLLYIIVSWECQRTAEETEVETDISLLTLLPLQVFIGCGIRLRTIKLDCILSEEHVVAHSGQYGITEVTDVIITILTPAGTELQVAQPIASTFHEFLVHNIPSDRGRWEGTIFMRWSETAWTISADCSLKHVLLIIVIAQSTEERRYSMHYIIATWYSMLNGWSTYRDDVTFSILHDGLAIFTSSIVDRRLVYIHKIPTAAVQIITLILHCTLT